jgi:hypothetical protein
VLIKNPHLPQVTDTLGSSSRPKLAGPATIVVTAPTQPSGLVSAAAQAALDLANDTTTKAFDAAVARLREVRQRLLLVHSPMLGASPDHQS